ncbi:MAG: serine/threonine protein kinase [Myxococcota bacterium]
MSESKSNSRRGPRLKPGEVFEGKYRLVEKLGTGSFAVVVKARHETMGRDVALKLLKPSVLKSNPEVSDRFIKEVQIVSKLRHPNTVTIYDFGEARGIHYMVLEYLEGVTLDQLTAHGAIEESRAIGICHQILKSLAEAHAIGIIHRDLKPSNIMLCEMHGETDFVKVLDFGVAKLLEESETVVGSGEQQRSTQFIGTPVYMSPEQVLGRSVGPSSDLYSLGLIFYEMLTGEPPMKIESVASVARLHLSSEPLPFAKLDSLSPAIQELILTATSREPSDRFQSVEAFAEALPLPGAVESVEKVQPEVETREASQPERSPDQSFEEMFSGQNYVEHFDVDSPDTDEDEPAASRSGADSRVEPVFGDENENSGSARNASKSGAGREARLVRPSTRPEELDIDMGSVKRQEIQAGRKKKKKAPKRSVDGTYESREYLVRGVTYVAGLVAFYLAFMIVTGALSTTTAGTRWVAGGLIPVAAVVWTVFSGVRAIGEDVGRTWLLPTARNFVYILGVVIAITAFTSPAETAAGLSNAPAWFLEPFSQTPLLSSIYAVTVELGHAIAGVYAEIDQILPY